MGVHTSKLSEKVENAVSETIESAQCSGDSVSNTLKNVTFSIVNSKCGTIDYGNQVAKFSCVGTFNESVHNAATALGANSDATSSAPVNFSPASYLSAM